MTVIQPVMGDYRPLTRRDLTGFDKTATALVLEAVERGWVGRLSSKGHAIMRAPDGETTMSVSRDSLRGRSGRNARAYFDRWVKSLPETPDGDSEAAKDADMPEIVEIRRSGRPASPEPTKDTPDEIEAVRSQNTASVVCGVCGEKFPSRSSLGSHLRKHALEDRPLARCPYCGIQRKILTRHLHREHSVEAADAYSKGGEKALWRLVTEERKREQEEQVMASLRPEAVAAAVTELIAERDRLRAENEDLRAKLDLARETLGL